ncbi:hypothetical protein B2J88_47915 [Rhodococcus sp. SRB_17]|nr:hypothetical protein [Rhodococcus sp. SRB_17]
MQVRLSYDVVVRRVLFVIVGCVLSWVLGAVVVRLGLDWADTFPYSEASEWRYLGVAMAATLVAIGGSVAAVLVARQRHRQARKGP